MKARIGIIGCGSVSWHVIHGYMQGPVKKGRAEIVAVCDLREDIAKSAAEWCSAKKIYSDYNQLLKDKEIDGVEILLPESLHARVAIATAEAGKHMSVIKTLGVSLKECCEIVKAARDAGVKLMYNEHEYYYPPLVKAKELIEAGEIGEPLTIDMTRSSGYTDWTRSPPGYCVFERSSRTSAGSSRDRAIGWIGSQCHRLATARNLMGEVKEVLWAAGELEAPDNLITWTYKKGGCGVLRVNRIPKVYVESIGIVTGEARTEVMGTEGVLWAVGPAAAMALTPRPAPLTMYKGDATIHFANLEGMMESLGGFKQQAQDFVDFILEDKKPKAVGEDGIADFKFGLAAVKSWEEGKPIAPDSITE